MPIRTSRLSIWLAVGLLLVYALSRLHALLALPVFLDEASHLTRAQWVWQGRPLYLLETGKALAPYLASAMWPFGSGTLFIGRFAVIALGLVGLAAAYGVGRALHSRGAGLVIMALWIVAPGIFFYERMALVDTTVSAMAMLALWLALRTLCTGRIAWAVGCGVALALVVLAKLTGLIFMPIPMLAAVCVPTRLRWSRRLHLGIVTYGVAGALLAPPLLYILVQGADPTGQSTALTSLDTASMAERLAANGAEIADGMRVFFGDPALLAMIGATCVFLWRAPRRAVLILALTGAPLITIAATANALWLRYASPAYPFLLIGLALGGALLAERMRLARRGLRLLLAVTGTALALAWLPFLLEAYRDPASLRLPSGDRIEYVTWIPTGYGIQAAAAYLAAFDAPATVIGTAVNCNGARLLLPLDSPVTMLCPDLDWGGRNYAPVVALMRQRLALGEDVYVLAEDKNPPTVPPGAFPASRTEIAVFQRPGGRFTVRLYRLTQP